MQRLGPSAVVPLPSFRIRSLAVGLAAVVVAAAGCGSGGDDTGAGPGDTTTTTATTTSTTAPTTTTTVSTTTSTTASTTTTDVQPTTTLAPLDPGSLPGGQLEPCQSPEGFSISRPTAWSTNSGDAVPACSQFHPQPFSVEAGTDRRVAAITVRIEPVPFAQLAAPDPGRGGERAVTAIDGLQAVRLAYQSEGGGLWPAGTPITQYLVDLSAGTGSGPGTLVLDTVGIPGFDHPTNQVVLDRMAQTLRISRGDVATDASVIARYGGGGGGFSVIGEAMDGRVCLRLPLDKEGPCADVPALHGLAVLQLVDLQPLVGGVAGEEVFRVTAERADGTTSSFLPAPVPGTTARAFAFDFGLQEVTSFSLFDVTGRRLGVVPAG